MGQLKIDLAQGHLVIFLLCFKIEKSRLRLSNLANVLQHISDDRALFVGFLVVVIVSSLLIFSWIMTR
jgi:hypothetical protein